MFYIIKFFVNLLIYTIKYVFIGFIIIDAIVCLTIVIPITIFYSILKWMWKFNTTALCDGWEYITSLYEEFRDIYMFNIPSFKTWK